VTIVLRKPAKKWQKHHKRQVTEKKDNENSKTVKIVKRLKLL